MSNTGPVIRVFSIGEDWVFSFRFLNSSGAAVAMNGSGVGYKIRFIDKKTHAVKSQVLDTAASGALALAIGGAGNNEITGQLAKATTTAWGKGRFSADLIRYTSTTEKRIVPVIVSQVEDGDTDITHSDGIIGAIVDASTFDLNGPAYIIYDGPKGDAWGSTPMAWVTGLVCVAAPVATVVTYLGACYRCNNSHTAGASFDATKFDLIVPSSDVTPAALAAQAAAEAARDGAIAAKGAADADAVATAADRVQTGLDRTAASGSATAAASSAASAVTAKTASESARDLTLGYKSSTQTLFDSVSAQALTVSGYATSAAASAASASAVSGLSNLSAAAKAIVTAADATVLADIETGRDTHEWRSKVASVSHQTEALNTSTRGARAQYPSRGKLVGRTTANTLSVIDFDDPTTPLWKAWTVAGITSALYTQGKIYYSGTGGVYEIDLILDAVWKRDTSGLWSCNQNVANYNQSTAVWTLVSASGAIVNATINSIAATVLPVTQPNPLRCGLPNPTVAIGTAGGVSVIRADGVVSSCSSTTVPFEDVAFDALGNLWVMRSSASIIYMIPRGIYMTPGWAITSGTTFTAAQLGVGTLKNVRAIPGGVAVSGSTGLAQIKLDAANPANSLISVTTDKYNTGWMHGAIKCAFAESNGDLSNLVGATPLNDAFTYADTAALQEVWVPQGAQDAANIVTAKAGSTMTMTRGAGGVSGAPAITLSGLIIGRTYQMSATLSGSIYWGVLSGAVLIGTSQGGGYSKYISFVATATTAVLKTWTDNSVAITFSAFRVDLVASDKSGAGNHEVITGTLTRSVVAAGAELAAYGGFSASNYLEGAPGAIDPASGDFTLFEGWVIVSAWANQSIVSRAYYTAGAYSGAYERLFTTAGGILYFKSSTNGGATEDYIAFNGLPTNIPVFIVAARRGNNLELTVNGSRQIAAMTNSSGSHTNANATMRRGLFQDGTYPAVNTLMALMRTGLSAPTIDQIAFIYADELKRFQANAKDLLAGSSNVQGLSYDPDADQLAIATAAGTNVFKYPIRTQYISVAGVADAAKLSSDNHKSVAFSGGDLVIASAAQVYGSLIATSGLREIAKKRASVPAYDPTWGIFNGVTTDATPTIIASTPILEGRAYRFRATVAAVQYGGTATEKAVYDVTGLVTRDIGGNVVVVSTTTTVSEVTSSMDCVAQANTTAQTLEIKATGKASTRLAWGVELELYDIGLMGAAA